MKVTSAAVGLLLAIVLAASMAVAPEARAAQQVACVNNKTGDMRLVSGKKAKKKCPKGWRKVRWEQVKGNLGYRAYSADGKLVGKVVGVTPIPGGLTTLSILRNGGRYDYTFGGFLFPAAGISGLSLSFTTPDCSGPAYAPLGGSPTPEYEALIRSQISGSFRVTARTITPFGFGPSKAWKFNGASQNVAVPTDLYEEGTDGTCTVQTPGYTGTLLEFSSVPAPPDFKGPLRLR
jgi:hypothetical protein